MRCATLLAVWLTACAAPSSQATSPVAAPVAAPSPLAAPEFIDQGTFVIEVAGVPAGRERFVLRDAPGGSRLELDTVLDFEDQRVVVRGWLEFDAAQRPRRGHYEARFGGTHLTIELERTAPHEVHLLVANGVVSTMLPVCALGDAATTRTAFPALDVTVGASQPLVLADGAARRVRARRVVLAGASHYVVACEGPRLVAVYAPLLELLAVRDGDGALAAALAPAMPHKPHVPAGLVALPRQVRAPAAANVGDAVLDCTLLVPAAYAAPDAAARLPRLPAAIFITGSGRHDRDGDPVGPGGLRAALFAHLATRLATHGIASLRCDDLGSARSTGEFAHGTRQAFTALALAQLASLAAEPFVDGARLAVIGHSEGGYLAPLVAAAAPRVRAIVLLAAPGRALEEVAAAQAADAARARGATPREAASAAAEVHAVFAAWRAGRPLPASLTASDRAAWEADATWFKSYLDHDPLAVAAALPRPAVLILQGDADRQIDPRDADLLADAFGRGGNRTVRTAHYPGLGHVFTQIGAGAEGEAAPGAPVGGLAPAPVVLGDVVAFLGGALGVR